MNYLAHALHSLDDPWVLAGTALPDWARVLEDRTAGRRARVRPHTVPAPGANGAVRDRILRGVHAHFADDRTFHGSAAFRETTGEIAARIRRAEPGVIRPSFYAHVLLEMLLDAALVREDPARAEAFQAALEALDVDRFARATATFAPVVAGDLARLVRRFRAVRILDGYAIDAEVTGRLDRVGRRVRQPALPAGFTSIVTAARPLVADRAAALLGTGLETPRGS